MSLTSNILSRFRNIKTSVFIYIYIFFCHHPSVCSTFQRRVTLSVHAPARAACQSLLEGAESLPTLMRTTSPDRSPLAQKLYFRLCLSYIFPVTIHSRFTERKVAIRRERSRAEPSWGCLLRFTSGHRGSLPPDSSSTPALFLLFPPFFFSSSLPPFCFPSAGSQTSPMTPSDSCLCSRADFLFHKKPLLLFQKAWTTW